MDKITRFRGEYDFLSNFYKSPVEYQGHTYATVEHAYVASKTLDENLRQKVRDIRLPSDAKRLGRTFSLRPDWDSYRLTAMRYLVYQKFLPNKDNLLDRLISTNGYYLEEGNTWGDLYWGVDIETGKGENHLGKILMEIRDIHCNTNIGKLKWI